MVLENVVVLELLSDAPNVVFKSLPGEVRKNVVVETLSSYYKSANGTVGHSPRSMALFHS